MGWVGLVVGGGGVGVRVWCAGWGSVKDRGAWCRNDNVAQGDATRGGGQIVHCEVERRVAIQLVDVSPIGAAALEMVEQSVELFLLHAKVGGMEKEDMSCEGIDGVEMK